MFFSQAKKSKDDRRSSPRQTCSLEAVALPGPHFCTVVDRSGAGLRLRFHRPYEGRGNLVVVLLESGQAYTVQGRWAEDGEMGVMITGQCDLTGLVPGTFAEARHAWARYRGHDRPYNQRSNDP
jgi:hypothetical protein